ncbi:MAG: anthranilate phosphoribosyltransferase [Steroidobacteraceae bacterium]
MRNALEKLLAGQPLSQAEAAALLIRLTAADTHAAVTGAVLAALRIKGVVAEELRGFADGMRALALRPAIAAGTRAIDIVGTGGDASGSLSISTGTALLTAACGVPVVKHGNRSISSKCGSGDVLEALGVRIPMDEEAAGRCLAATGFTFLFAPYYHPAMKAVAQARAALGVRTIFNILGPLTNPASPPLYVIGAYSPEVARLMAEAVSGMPIERAFVVHGSHGWDEPTPVGPFMLFDIHPGHVTEQIRDPEEFGLARCRNQDLAGGDAQHNARALRAALSGEDRGAHRDCLLLGAALALEVAGKTRSAREGVAAAAAAIDSGAAARTLNSVADFAQTCAGVA